MPTSTHNRTPFCICEGFNYTAPASHAITVQELCQDLDKQGGPVVWWVTDTGGLTYAVKPRDRARILTPSVFRKGLW